MKTQPRENGRGLRALWSSERGGVAMYLGFAMLFILPLMAGAVSVSQIYTLNTELQQAADAAALAAAVELDGTEAGCTAAIAAAQNAVKNFQSFANDGGGAEAKLSSIKLLESLPPAPLTDFERLGVPGRYEAVEAKKCEDARYVRVVTELREQVSYPMRAYLILTELYIDEDAADSDADSRMVTASAAVAGHVTVACKTMPLMMCNPIEIIPGENCGDETLLDDADTTWIQDGENYNTDLAAFFELNPQWHRRMFKIKWIGPNAQASAPGVFGLLEPFFSDKKAVPGILEEFAIEDPPICIQLDSPLVDIKTGQAQAIVNGLNVRFDMYRGPVKSMRNTPGFRPARNVTKGLKAKGDVCVPDEPPNPADPQWMKLPEDECFANQGASGNCYIIASDSSNPQFDARIGDGDWDIAEYFRVNHPTEYSQYFETGTENLLLEQIRDSVPAEKYVDDAPVNIDNPPSRFAVYNWELAMSQIPGEDTRMDGGTMPEEEGKRPAAPTEQCSSSFVDSPDRRGIYVAVVNCCQQKEAMSSGERVVRVDAFLEGFLTEPAAWNGSNNASDQMGAIYLEAVRVLKPGNSDQVVIRDYVQLY